MKTIKFNLNWNCKLYCNVFSTLRPRDDEKYQLDEVYQILLKGNDMGEATAVMIKHFKLSMMTEAIALIDTGYTKQRAIEIIATLYPDIENIADHEFSYILLERTIKDSNHNNQYNELQHNQAATIPLPG
ncbi:hypothetical protein [Nubsella zeaxanthinifaciens]|uniref:hypothetical protein n=1 Tax=Nubsella zeaxanthinifaciens TaxID=392412 RepID=UPI000DE52D00|nr:hypothetical protein [Nubsella zeaxanthinifaciens]